MTINQDFTSSKKRMRIFFYEFEGEQCGDTKLEGKSGDAIKEDAGFFLIIASVMVVLCLMLLGLDLVLSPGSSLKQVSHTERLQSNHEFPPPTQPEKNRCRDRFTDPRDQIRENITIARNRWGIRREPFQMSAGEPSHRHHNSPVSKETSFTTTSIPRNREYWL